MVARETEGDEDDEERKQRRGLTANDGMEDFEVNLENLDCPLREWIGRDRTRGEIKRRFKKFLVSFKSDGGADIHIDRIREMCANNEASLEVRPEAALGPRSGRSHATRVLAGQLRPPQ